MKFYVAENEKPVGPFTIDELVARGLKSGDLVWTEGYENWVPADSVEEIRIALFAPKSQDEQYRETAIPELPSQQPTVPPTPPTQQPQPTQPQYQQPQPQPQQSYELPPKTWLVESIIVTILCCLPFGIVGIIKASNVNSLWQAGRYDDARRASAQAKIWTISGAITGFIVGVIYIGAFVALGLLQM